MKELLPFTLALAIGLSLATVALADSIPVGTSSFEFRPPDAAPMRVFTHRPEGAPSPLPVVVVLHGTSRNADDYRDNWIEIADRLGVLLLAPEFTKADYPTGYGYQSVGVFDSNRVLRPKPAWAPTRIEQLYDHVVRSGDAEQGGYYLFGHSAGGQFVHRMMLLMPEARTRLAIAANPGWYTGPDLSLEYTAGLAGTGVTEDGLRESLGREVVVLLGDADNDPNGKNLPRGRSAMAQGPHRFARGKWFYGQLEKVAEELDVPLAWRREIVPGVGHSNGKMAPAAARLIEQDLESRRQ